MNKHIATPPGESDIVEALPQAEADALVAEQAAWAVANPLPGSKDFLKAYLAHYRWTIEEGGITFGGLPIRTDERSRGLLSGIQRKIVKEADDTRTRNVKTLAGFYVRLHHIRNVSESFRVFAKVFILDAASPVRGLWFLRFNRFLLFYNRFLRGNFFLDYFRGFFSHYVLLLVVLVGLWVGSWAHVAQIRAPMFLSPSLTWVP